VTTSDGVELVPDFQIDEGRKELVQDLPEILERFSQSNVNPWNVASWLTAPREELNGATPIELLRRHAFLDVVIREVEIYLEGTHQGGKLL
jgi:Protein of unknown function (DUF2384)